MDTQRLILFMLFTFSSFFLIDAWQKDAHPPVTVPALERAEGHALRNTGALRHPAVCRATFGRCAVRECAGDKRGVAEGRADPRPDRPLIAVIDTAGGDLRHLELLMQRDTLDKTKNFALLEATGRAYICRAIGIDRRSGPRRIIARVIHGDASTTCRLGDGVDGLGAPRGRAASGVESHEVYTFHRGSYVIDVGYEVEQQERGADSARRYFQLVRDGKPPAGDSAMLPTYTGMAVYTEKEKFQKVASRTSTKDKSQLSEENATTAGSR